MKTDKQVNEAPRNGCAVYRKCGGCQLRNMAYEDQLRYKQGKVIRLLGKFGRIDKILGMDEPYHYRNKVQAAFARNRKGIISGVYQSGSGKIVPVDLCMIEDEKADEIIVTVRRLLGSFKLTVYDARTMRGFLRHVLVRRSFATGQIMVVLVSGTSNFPCKNDFVKELIKAHPDITTVIHNVNKKSLNLTLGRESSILYGNGKIEDVLCGCKFRISAASFYQVNPIQTEKLYSMAVEYMGLTGDETVVDAYCGTGIIGIIAASKARRVIGVELNGDAVKDARENAELNGIKNIEFYKGDASLFMEEMAEENIRADVVIMDPPRAGSTVKFMSAAVKLSPKRIVYVSCNPETLARDLNYLTKNGYAVKRITPVDMFPHTDHCECCVQLYRK